MLEWRHPRAERLLVDFRRVPWLRIAEIGLLALIAVQAVRLLFTVATPLGPLGSWTPDPLAPASAPLPKSFDPFFRLQSPGAAAVSGLDLRLFGVREDQASGQGSAIIALPDGSQRSFAVGEDIMPNVRLQSVAFDHVVIDRSGVAEQIFLDQSTPAPAASVPAATPVFSSPTLLAQPAADALRFEPRLQDGRLIGVAVAPGADGGEAFRAAGFVPGDVILAVGGRRLESLEQVAALARTGRGEVSLLVDRGGRHVSLRAKLGS